jgi:hypothetical protein
MLAYTQMCMNVHLSCVFFLYVGDSLSVRPSVCLSVCLAVPVLRRASQPARQTDRQTDRPRTHTHTHTCPCPTHTNPRATVVVFAVRTCTQDYLPAFLPVCLSILPICPCSTHTNPRAARGHGPGSTRAVRVGPRQAALLCLRVEGLPPLRRPSARMVEHARLFTRRARA